MARAGAAAARLSDERFIRLYLDMLAAERGAGANTLAAYARDLEDLAAHLKATRRCLASARTADLRAYLEDLARRGLRAVVRARSWCAARETRNASCRSTSRRGGPRRLIWTCSLWQGVTPNRSGCSPRLAPAGI